MAAITSRAVAYDSLRDKVLVMLFSGKRKVVAELSEHGELRLIRKVTAISEQMWAATVDEVSYALFWGIGRVSAVPLLGGRSKTLTVADKATFLRHAVAADAPSDKLFVTTPTQVYEFRGASFELSRAQGTMFWARNDGFYQLPFAGKPKFEEHSMPNIKASTYCRNTERVIAIEHHGRVSIQNNKGNVSTLEIPNAWAVAAYQGGIYTSTNRSVWKIEVGREPEPQLAVEPFDPCRDDCLTSTPQGLFAYGKKKIHRLKDGRWSSIDLVEKATHLFSE